MPEIGIDPAPVINEESCEPISDDLRLTLLGKNPDESIRVIITLKEQPGINNLKVNRFLENGLNDLYQERVIERRELIEQRKEDVFSLQENLIDEVNALDGVLYKQFWLVNAIAVEMLPEQILELNSHPDVANVELDTTATFLDDGDGQNYVTMVDVRRVTQSEYYRDANPDRYEGQNPSGRVDIPGVNESRLVVAVIDGEPFDEDHYALNDGSTHYNPSKRIIARYDCVDENGSCVAGQLENYWYYPNNRHSLLTSGVILSDLTENQDAGYSGNDALRRTGMAPEAELVIMHVLLKTEVVEAIETATQLSVDVINLSLGFYDGRYLGEDFLKYCPSLDQASGRDIVSLEMNAAFKSGIFISVAAGNQDYCYYDTKETAPALAHGVFTVGAYNACSEDPNNDFADSGDFVSGNSFGPTYDGRIKPDILTPTKVGYTLNIYNSYFNNPSGGGSPNPIFIGTSASAPVLSGSATVLLDWAIDAYGQGAAGEPGRLFVNLLNFGDRRYAEYEEDPTGFSPVYGSGRLRLRLPTSEGMDSPWRWETTHFNFTQDNQTYSLYLNRDANDNPIVIPSDAAILKIAIWWYEDPSQLYTMKAQFNARVKKQVLGLIYQTVEEKSSSDDQKIHFIFDNESDFQDFVTNKRYRLEITSTHIPAGYSRTVWVSYFWEDLSRDDADGPCHDPGGNCDETDDNYLFYR